MKLSQQNYKCTEKAYACLDNLFAISLYDDFDIDCSTDENGDIDIIAGKFYKWDSKDEEYTLYKIKMQFDCMTELADLHVSREGIVVGKKRIDL